MELPHGLSLASLSHPLGEGDPLLSPWGGKGPSVTGLLRIAYAHARDRKAKLASARKQVCAGQGDGGDAFVAPLRETALLLDQGLDAGGSLMTFLSLLIGSK